MPAITIELDRIARTFTRSTAILTARLRWARTTRILALVLIVRHGILLKVNLRVGVD